MGSRVSYNDIDGLSSSTRNSESTSSTSDNLSINNSNTNVQNSSDQSIQSHVYIKDKFQLEFLDCNCCCDTTKKIANCDFQGINILQDLYEMVVTPEYKLNCHCSCGDDNGNTKQSIKFGLTGSPNVDITYDDRSTSSDSEIKE